MDTTIDTDKYFDLDYPCSCGHCPECGLNFVAPPEEERRWAEEGTTLEDLTNDFYDAWVDYEVR